MLILLLTSLMAFASPYADVDENLGKIPQGEVIIRYKQSCCLSGRVDKSAALILKGKKGQADLETTVLEGDIDGETSSVTHSAFLKNGKIFVLSETTGPNYHDWNGSIWYWDNNKKEFIEDIQNAKAFKLTKQDKPDPKVVYAGVRELFAKGEPEKAWHEIMNGRKKNFWDSFRTTNIQFQENSGHSAHMVFFGSLRDVVHSKIGSGQKDKARQLLCRTLDLPDFASYLDGTEVSNPCEIADIAYDPDAQIEGESYEMDSGRPLPKNCFVEFGNFKLAKTEEARSLVRTLKLAVKKTVTRPCPSLSKFKNLVEKRKPATQVEKALKEYEKAGGSPESIVENDSNYHGAYSIPYYLANKSYFGLARRYLKAEIPYDHSSAVALILRDKTEGPKMKKDLEAWKLNTYPQEVAKELGIPAKEFSPPKLNVVERLPEPLKAKVAKAMNLP